MRVLSHVHTFNDAEVIEQALGALQRQTRPPEGIVIVDNASTDGTLDRAFPEGVTVVRNSANLGSSGAVGVGFAHAMQQKFDWTWVLDADSVPEPDALEKLLAFFEHLPPSHREQVSFLACRVAPRGGELEHRPYSMTKAGMEYAPRDDDAAYCRCDGFIWSGSLFRMAAVARIGLPCADYFIDLAELEYGYRAQKLGLTGYVVNSALLHQDVGRPPGATRRTLRVGSFSFPLIETGPLRSYYFSRNILYFWLYQCRPYRPRWMFRSIAQALVFTMGFALRPVSHRRQLIAGMRGIRDGLTAHMERRY
jgi:rhamnopyranosyl-N-acetylglucosaminyl-diphospho-decaprenol beta-1,3/1,4-galactofuranosyltransferase